jgi:hypothetical protein
MTSSVTQEKSIGGKASIAAAKIMAGVGHDLMTNADLRKAGKADFVPAHLIMSVRPSKRACDVGDEFV